MKFIMRFTIAILFLLFVSKSYSQQAKIDSLLNFAKTATDTTLVNALNDIAYRYGKLGDSENAINYTKQALENSEKINYRKGEAVAYRNYGVIFRNQGNYVKSLEYHTKALQISTADNDKKSISAGLNNIANIYFLQGDYQKSLETHFRSLKIKEEIKDKKGIGTSLNGIASVYYVQGNLDISLDYYNRAMKIREELGDKSGIAMALNNIGGILNTKKEYEKANDYFQKALAIQKELGEMTSVSNTLNSLAGNYTSLNKYPEARNYFTQALAIQEKNKDRFGIATSYNNIGNICIMEGNLGQAKDYLDKALLIAKVIGAKDLLKEVYANLTNLNKKQRNFEQALLYQSLFIQTKDSLMNEQSMKTTAEMNMKYETEKKELQISSLEKDKTLSEYEINKQKNFKYSLMAFSSLFVVLAFALFKGYNTKKKANEQLELQKREIEIQKMIVDEKNKDITDSINYAKRIQAAILPSIEDIQKHITDSFIFYQPKDIVSGDFYWFAEKDNHVIIAIADCTGHGVPGAFMSMVGNDILTQIVIEKGITKPSMILTHLHDGVKKSLKQDTNASDTKDGMDIAIVSFDKTNHSTIEFAGALRPFWLIKNNTSEIIEYKGDKHSIGGAYSDDTREFTNHKIELSKGDSFYLSTDGYADQFGGKQGKKMMTKNMKKLIIEIQTKFMTEQKLILENNFKDWKTNREQVDDVLVFGVRI